MKRFEVGKKYNFGYVEIAGRVYCTCTARTAKTVTLDYMGHVKRVRIHDWEGREVAFYHDNTIEANEEIA